MKIINEAREIKNPYNGETFETFKKITTSAEITKDSHESYKLNYVYNWEDTFMWYEASKTNMLHIIKPRRRIQDEYEVTDFLLQKSNLLKPVFAWFTGTKKECVDWMYQKALGHYLNELQQD